MDDVIVDLSAPWHDEYCRKYGDSISINELFSDWNIHNRAVCGDLIYEIIKQPGFFENLPQIFGSIGGMMFLNGVADTYLVSAISKCGEIAKGKVIWTQKNMPFFNLQKMILCKAKHLVRGDIFIDDRLKNIQTWKEWNPDGITILMNTHSNRSKESNADFRVDDWNQIRKIIAGILGKE